MWNDKKKAITFSFDDGVKQDERLIAILNKYGLKATFNINSSLLGLEGNLNWGERKIAHNKINPYDVKSVYQGQRFYNYPAQRNSVLLRGKRGL